MDAYDFLNSNLFQTIIIFFTGLTAFIIYRINRYNEKKDAACVIVNEIRLAEKTIQEIRNNKFVSELSIILPNDTWQHKKHLFLNKLDEDELNLINNFYYKCSYAEQYRKMIYNVNNKAIYTKSNYLQKKLVDLMYETLSNPNKSYEQEKNKLIDMANKENWLFSPNTPMSKLVEYIENIIFITPTSAGIKLKRILK